MARPEYWRWSESRSVSVAASPAGSKRRSNISGHLVPQGDRARAVEVDVDGYLDVLETFRRERVKIIHSNPELRHHLESNLVVELNVRGVAMGTDATLGNWRGGAEDRRRTAGKNRLAMLRRFRW